MNKQEIINQIKKLKDERFMLWMRNRWTDEDYQTDTHLQDGIRQLMEVLKQYD